MRMATENSVGVQTSPMESEEGHLRCTFCSSGQDQVRQLIGGPDGIFICDRCVLLCVDIIEANFEDRGRAAFRHCLVHADEPRYYDLQRHSEEQRNPGSGRTHYSGAVHGAARKYWDFAAA